MKKVTFVLGLFLVLFSACSTGSSKYDYELSKDIAYDYILNSNVFIDNRGFDVSLRDETVVQCGNDCYDYEYTFGVLGDKIGYNVDVRVEDGVASFLNDPKTIR